jgi:hypothetical protein
MTQYVIVQENGSGDELAVTYTVVDAAVTASSAEQARRRYADTLPDEDLPAKLYAVPSRHWAGETYEAKTTRRVVKAQR